MSLRPITIRDCAKEGNCTTWFPEKYWRKTPACANGSPPEQLQVMKEAVEDHRASCDHEPRSLYGKIVAEADRIIDPEITLRRTVQYGLSHYPEMTAEEQYARFKEHLTVKYGPNGYLQLWIPESSNAARLAEFRKILADEEQLRSTFRRLYEAEQQAASANAR